MASCEAPIEVDCSAAGAALGELVVRIRGTSRDGQIIRLGSAKCAIGSGPQCTLRLHARGVRPLHCLVVRGSHATVVRRWSADTRLNGRTFTDAELQPGDRLGIGTLELEVMNTSAVVGATESGEVSLQTPDSVDRLVDELARQEKELSERAEQIDARCREFEDRLRQFEQQQETWQAEREQLEQQLTRRSEELDARLAGLESQEQVLAEQHEALERQQDKWQAERSDESIGATARQRTSKEEVTFEEPPEQAPVDLTDVLEKTGAAEPSPDDGSGVSNDASSWTTIYSTSSGDGGIDDLAVSGSGRYVRMYGTTRGTAWGYSLWEFEVYAN